MEIIMTPAINYLKKHKIEYKIYQYTHDTSHESYGLEATQKLNLNEEKVFKTLIVELDNKELAVGIIPVVSKLNMKMTAKVLGAKKAIMADKILAEKTTGYILGGISPLGQKKKLKTVIHISAKNQQSVFVSAGRRGLEIELSPNDLIKHTNASFQKLC